MSKQENTPLLKKRDKGHSKAFDKIHSEHKDEQKSKLDQYSKEKNDKDFFKNLDTSNPEQMDQLKKRDIKRYRKEMRKIKKAMGPGVQVQPKPIREPEAIKEIKAQKFSKIRQKLAADDYQNMVKNCNPESVAKFVNLCLKDESQWPQIDA